VKLTKDNSLPILDELIANSGAMTAVLVTKEGYNMVSAGDVSYLNTTALAALVAGMFSATRAVATMVGEKQFSILLQQGKTRNIHISLINDSIMMVIVFENHQRIGKVRMEAQKAGDAMIAILAAPEPGEEKRPDLAAPEFKEYALALVDMIFSAKKA